MTLEGAMSIRPGRAINAASAFLSLTLCALVGTTPATAGPPAFVQNGKAGFVVANIEYALSRDAKDTGACPDGMTQGVRREGTPYGVGAGQGGQRPAGNAPGSQRAEGAPGGGQRPEGVSDEEAQRRFLARFNDPNGKNACMNPEAFKPDPNYRTVGIRDAKAFGIDLDGQNSRAGGKPAPGTCSHSDFDGMNGEHGVDNQFFRVVGCSNSFQSTGQSNTYAIEMLTGSWGILITLSGLDDIRNDDNVEVGLFANADPIELSPTREPLPNATYAIEQDPRFQAKTRGRIKNGVLTTDPVDVRFHWVVNSMRLERPLRDARVQMTLSDQGVLEGYLAGYTPVEAMYDLQFGYRDGKDGAGQLASLRLRLGSSNGAAAVLGHTCNGAYYALHENADGHPDPATGQCTSISTQYRLKAISAFVVDAKTKSANEELDRR
jgi:hypothetical protein